MQADLNSLEQRVFGAGPGAATLQTLKDIFGRVLDQLHVTRLTGVAVCHGYQ